MYRWPVAFFCFVLMLNACVEEPVIPGEVNGYKPLYLQDTNADTVTVRQPQPVVHGGRIVLYKSWMFQVELNRGVHIFDLQDTANISKVLFYEIFGCNQLSIQSDHMYVNTITDLLVINIADLLHPRITDYKKGFYRSFPFIPPPAHGYFECVDPSRGLLTGWKDTLLNNPKCLY